MSMTSSRPYLIRAIHSWITDNALTPHLLVDAGVSGVQVPREYVENGRIILNVSEQAVSGLCLDNERIQFSARFAGRVREVSVPTQAVLMIYARENGQGMVLEEENDRPPPPPAAPSPGKQTRSHLKLVK